MFILTNIDKLNLFNILHKVECSGQIFRFLNLQSRIFLVPRKSPTENQYNLDRRAVIVLQSQKMRARLLT